MAMKHLLLAVAVLLPLASACIVSKVDVALAMPAMSGNLSADAYDAAAVTQHFEVNKNEASFLKTGKTAVSFACVDSRSEDVLLGTPGGDIAELMGGIFLYFGASKAPVTKEAVAAIVNKYLDGLPGKRRFYFHQGDLNMRNVYAEVNAATGKKYVTMPDVLPAGEEAAWMAALTKGGNQGCGHMRLMIDQFADYGLPSADVPKFVIEAFYKYWWPTPIGSSQRKKVNFEILQGSLSGKAVAIVDPTADSGSESCLKAQAPAMATSHIGSQVFIYHQKAASTYRQEMLAPWFGKYAQDNGVTLDLEAFKKAYEALHGTQLTATLKNLSPVKNLNIFSVKATVSKK